jgi:16S rRNA (adenine1518-N6/adenine1519-N6)-dimethyltransferase
MKIASKNHVFKTLDSYHLIAKKGYGQNFLINENITKGIISNCNIDSEELIIEIGPGLGALTEELLESYPKVIAIEIDRNMVRVLNDTFNNDKLEIINEDFLKINLNELIEKNNEFAHVSIVSNLPYYITSDILEKIIISKNEKLDKLVVMMQKEVGKKLLKNDHKIDSFLNFLISNYCSVKELIYVSKNDFIPRPNVDSLVLEIELKDAKYKIKDESRFFYVFKECLKNKRKFLISNLMNILMISKEEILIKFKELKIKENVRIEELSVEAYINLINNLC